MYQLWQEAVLHRHGCGQVAVRWMPCMEQRMATDGHAQQQGPVESMMALLPLLQHRMDLWSKMKQEALAAMAV
jgi:hypothetical protein